jgi:hypothetical protein
MPVCSKRPNEAGSCHRRHASGEWNRRRIAGFGEIVDQDPLEDLGGNTIGALGLNFGYKDGDDRQSLERKAEAIRDELKRRTADAANLVEPYPFDPAATTLTHAQKLVDRTLAQYAGLLSMRLCTASPASETAMTSRRCWRPAQEFAMR